MNVMIELFRNKGYAAVSLDDLSSATGLSRPSLYRTFGSKVEMYVGAMDAFGVQVAHEAAPKLFATDDLAADLTSFLDAMLTIYFRDEDVTPGCLVFGTAPSAADEAAVQARLKLGLDHVDALMRSRFEKAVPNADPTAVQMAVEIASNTLIAFSARAKSGTPKSVLSEMGAHSAHAVAVLLDAA